MNLTGWDQVTGVREPATVTAPPHARISGGTLRLNRAAQAFLNGQKRIRLFTKDNRIAIVPTEEGTHVVTTSKHSTMAFISASRLAKNVAARSFIVEKNENALVLVPDEPPFAAVTNN